MGLMSHVQAVANLEIHPLPTRTVKIQQAVRIAGTKQSMLVGQNGKVYMTGHVTNGVFVPGADCDAEIRAAQS